MVFTCLALSVFSTIDEYEQEATDLLFYLEIVVVIWFSIEFVLRWVIFLTYIETEYLRNQNRIANINSLTRHWLVI